MINETKYFYIVKVGELFVNANETFTNTILSVLLYGEKGNARRYTNINEAKMIAKKIGGILIECKTVYTETELTKGEK